MTPPSQQQTSIPSPGSTCSSTSGHQQHSPPHRPNHSPARSLPSPVTPPMPLSLRDSRGGQRASNSDTQQKGTAP
ncbi:hypothetical protein JOQ06_017867 [Pogonophryne albipinna]|uniref:Uncharacterized protein n=1 Tax=Pogonophryne albipinna TaxID=1090488 RepID=A0AAD6AGV9_9TELE|nr:hypothetical protein JOQ06_017867 [Pogonophryne albipinna]